MMRPFLLAILALVASAADPDARTLLLAQADAYRAITWADVESVEMKDWDFRPSLRGLPPAEGGRVIARTRLVIDVVARAYRYEHHAIAEQDKAKPDAVPVLAYLEIGNAHLIERFDVARSRVIIVQWDSTDAVDPDLFDQSQACNSLLVWPIRSLRARSLASGIARDSIFDLLDGSAARRFLGNPEVKELPETACETNTWDIGGIETVVLPERTLSWEPVVPDPMGYQFHIALRPFANHDGRWLVAAHSPESQSLQVRYEAVTVAGGTDPLFIPVLVYDHGVQRTERFEINGRRPDPALFVMDHTQAKSVYDQTADIELHP